MTLEDAKKLTTFAKTYGLGGLHCWSINRDVPGTDVRTRTSALCHGLSAERKLALTEVFLQLTDHNKLSNK